MFVDLLPPYLIIASIMGMVILAWIQDTEFLDSKSTIIDRYVLNTSIKLSILSIVETDTRVFVLKSVIKAVKIMMLDKKEIDLHLFIDNLTHYFKELETDNNVNVLLGFICSLKTNLKSILGRNEDLRKHVIRLDTLHSTLVKLGKKI